MNVTDYWPMAREYSVWNAPVAAFQFWTADLKVHVRNSTIEQVYNEVNEIALLNDTTTYD